ncbi:ubiquitin-conjugating enzyme/RWD-like protein [Microdochium trichocladiopsis]|uniref:Ubiquitin-conjugating enzyme/RWD-like protein n=1 Tax=Microdochium trichocladiopsis TaxID=1682393 RepID=A0A9P9BPR4_9PEZI|nr:ubiquitin-conjugating enzyme/RWD-like protein [Microdochium trichocladiopsis]KAH7033399.1 ubiquitin-conjugating enzyme/RWD-like protein [Microdochium trichocladiopsis]
MSAPRFNAKSPTIRRILKEAAELTNSPSPDYVATPLESDLFEWHFTLRGPPQSDFAQGIYHGRIVLPPTYPLRPPSFRFTTPSGRFEPNREICLSISGHHEETWQPAWGVRTALVALRSFMESDAKGQIGGIDSSEAVRLRFAAESRRWQCPGCAKTNEDILAESEARWKELDAAAAGSGSGSGDGTGSRKEVEIPAELKMGFRDEMEAAAAAAKAGSGSQPGQTGSSSADAIDEESAQLAEGFVQTAPIANDSNSSPAPQAHARQNPPAPTRTIPLPPPQQPQMRQAIRPIDPSAGVPPWVDYAIATLVCILAAMVFKIMSGY